MAVTSWEVAGDLPGFDVRPLLPEERAELVAFMAPRAGRMGCADEQRGLERP